MCVKRLAGIFTVCGCAALAAGEWSSPAFGRPTRNTLGTTPAKDDMPDVAVAKRNWLVERQRIASWLDSKDTPTAEDLGIILKSSPGGEKPSVAAWPGNHAYLVSEPDEAGIFVITKMEDNYQVVWDYGPPDEADLSCPGNNSATVGKLPD